MRKVGYALTALAATMAAGAASAATIVASGAGSTPGIYFNYDPNVGGDFGNDDPTVAAGRFNDTYTFSTGFERSATVEITSSYPGTSPQTSDFSRNVNFVFNGVKLNTRVIEVTSSGQNERRYLANFRIPAGVQNIFVNGSAGVAGVYAGLLSLSSVPEPQSWALMIIGFGFIGGAMRRRAATKVSFA